MTNEPMIVEKPIVFVEVEQQRFVRLVRTDVPNGQILNWHTGLLTRDVWLLPLLW